MDRLAISARAIILFGLGGLGLDAVRAQPAPVLEASPAIQMVELTKTAVSWDGSRLPAYPEGQPEITILRATIPAGARFPLHKHPVINAAVILSGELAVFTEDGDSTRVRAGESLVEVVEKWHFGENDGPDPVEIVVFYAGTEGQAVTVTE